MRRRLAVLTAAIVAWTLTSQLAGPADAHASGSGGRPYRFAVIGDTPYGDSERARFPGFVDAIDAHSEIRALMHVGDIKDGASPCTDRWYTWVRRQLNRFDGPVIYTPGDNEWADCRSSGYRPLERLAYLREVFFRTPRTTIGGQPMRVSSQAERGVPENVRFVRGGACFGTTHVIGGNDGAGQGTDHPRRMRAALAVAKRVFDAAAHGRCRAVVLLLQADMFNRRDPEPTYSRYSAYRPLVARIANRAARFRGPVLLLNGDSHVFTHDRPLAVGSSWLRFYGLTRAAPNVQRVTVAGDRAGTHEFVRVALRPGRSPYLRITRVRI